MKYLIILFFCFSIPCLSQWYYYYPYGREYDFKSVSFVDTLNGWVCGTRGGILHTSNGGETWVLQKSNVSCTLVGIKFYSLLSGWAIGDTAVILHTTDGGITWMKRSRSGTETFNDLSVVNDSSCWIVGGNKTILFTSDHGNHWQNRSYYLSMLNFNSCHFFNDKIGWVTGYYDDYFYPNRALIYTIDGVNWITSMQGPSYTFSDVTFTDDHFGWVSGYMQSNKRTTNGGTWVSMPFFQDKNVFSLKFINRLVGWGIIEINNSSWIYKTYDGGLTWLPVYSITEQMSDMTFVNNNCGWIVGPNGLIQKTSDGGVSWKRQLSIEGFQSLNTLFFLNKNYGLAAGHNSIVRTTDAGKTWNLDSCSYSFENLCFTSEYKGWGITSESKIFSTTDKGKTWVFQYALEPYYYDNNTISFIDSLNGWSSSYRKIYKTTNGGQQWNNVYEDTSAIFSACYFFTKERGYFLNLYGKLCRTTDAGLNWEVDPLLNNGKELTSIYFADDLHGIIAGENGTILKTHDGGYTWENYQTFPNDYLTSLYMVDPFNVWATGYCYVNDKYTGIIRRSTDGGITWTKSQYPESDGLSAIFFADNNLGFIAGYKGILKYGNPPTNIKDEYVIPGSLQLHQNYPNPFNPVTNIRFQISKESLISLKVYDILGREITTLINEEKKSGDYEITFNGSGLSSGVYIYRLVSDGKALSKKCLLLK